MSKGQPVLDKNGEPIKAFICPYRKPMEYYALKDADGKIKKTSSIENKHELEIKDGDEILKMKYDGCPHWQKKQVIDDFLQ
jgi:hypothetical protein